MRVETNFLFWGGLEGLPRVFKDLAYFYLSVKDVLCTHLNLADVTARESLFTCRSSEVSTPSIFPIKNPKSGREIAEINYGVRLPSTQALRGRLRSSSVRSA